MTEKFYYAQLNSEGKVIGISTLKDEVNSSSLIRIPEEKLEIVGLTYQDGVFIGDKRTKVDNNYIIDTISYNPINNVIENITQKTEPVSSEELLEELKKKYIPLINEANLLGDIIEKERLQQEYLTKKTEITT